MKKVAPLIMALAIIIFSIPVLHTKAESGLFGVYTQESIGTVFSDTTLQTKLNSILLTNDQVGTYDIFNTMDNASFDITTDNIVIITFSSGGGYAIQSFDVPEDVGFIYYDSSTSPRSGYYYCVNDNDDQTVAGRTPITGNLIYSENLDESTISREMVAFYPWGSGQQGQLTGDGCLLYSPIPVYSKAEAIENGAPSSTSGSDNIYLWMLNNADSLTDIRGDGAVWNGTDVIIPDSGDSAESIDNHLFAKTFDIGFCMNPNVWNGNINLRQGNFGNFYFQYTLDNYASVNISDLLLYVNTSVVSPEGNFTDSFSFPLDGDGFITYGNNFIVNNYTWLQDTSLFTIIYDSEIAEGFKRMQFLSGLTVERLQSSYAHTMGASGRSRLIYNSTGERIDSISDYPTSSVTYPDTFRVSFDCYIMARSTEETSGHFTKTFDFVNGTTTLSDSGIYDNDNPYEGIPDMEEVVPFENAFSTAGQAGNAVVNVATQIIYPTYKELKYDLESNPDGNFTQYLSPLSNNQFGTWFLSFVNEMPPQVKSLLITGVGVGVLFGIMRYVRRG